MHDIGFWFLIPAILATLLTLVVTGAMIYALHEIINERMTFWQRSRRG